MTDAELDSLIDWLVSPKRGPMPSVDGVSERGLLAARQRIQYRQVLALALERLCARLDSADRGPTQVITRRAIGVAECGRTEDGKVHEAHWPGFVTVSTRQQRLLAALVEEAEVAIQRGHL